MSNNKQTLNETKLTWKSWRGRVSSNDPKCTESKFEQWPHLTVIMLKTSLLFGTTTWKLMKKNIDLKKKENINSKFN